MVAPVYVPAGGNLPGGHLQMRKTQVLPSVPGRATVSDEVCRPAPSGPQRLSANRAACRCPLFPGRFGFVVSSNPPKNASPACKLSQNCIRRHLFAQKSCLSLHLSAIIKSQIKKEDRGLHPQSPFSQRKTLSIKVFLSTPWFDRTTGIV